MSRPSNQEIEKYYFKLFTKDFILPNGELEYGDKPDVIILSTKKIGIEIANLYLVNGAVEASEQVQRKRRETVIKLAEADYKLKSNLNHEFYISFNSMVPLIDIKSTAVRLVDFIISVKETLGNFFASNAFNISAEIYSVYRSPKQYPRRKMANITDF